MTDSRFDRWLIHLEQRHFASLTTAEVGRALRALSSGYVERRDRLRERSPFESAGKRAAYALYYGPLHFLTVRHLVRALGVVRTPTRGLLDVGCGTGAVGAAWATSVDAPPRLHAIDVHPWAVDEAAATYRAFALEATVRRRQADSPIPRGVDALVAGWVLNEADATARSRLQCRWLDAATRGVQVLVVEPIATRIAPWWEDWIRPFLDLGARADEWRFDVELPEPLKRLDRAAGLRHDHLTARSVYIGSGARDRCAQSGRHVRVSS
jgi:hypothetical protein